MNQRDRVAKFINFDTIPRWIVMVFDILISLFALALAYLVRFDFYADRAIIVKEWFHLKDVLPFVILLKPIVLYFFKIHKGLVRHTSVEDIKRIFSALFTYSLILFVAGLVRFYIFDGRFILPTSVIIVEFLASLLFMIGSRFFFKTLYYEFNKPKIENENYILIYGAGVSGLITKRTIERDPKIKDNIVGFIDDNKKLEGNILEGTPIYHSSKLETLITKHDITELIVAIQHPNKNKLTHLIENCLENNVTVKRVPSFQKWINGEFTINQIRKVNIEDLLGRESINLEVESVKHQLKDKVVLITGAAGSIGGGITRLVVNYKVKQLILLDQAESDLYDLHIDLLAQGHRGNLEIVIGDVRDYSRMDNVFRTLQPEIVFHAAAYKHVPLMESNPSESIKTNVLGTKNVVDLADKYKVEKMVIISTDKAVNPTNVMGASKRIAEIYAQTKNETSKTQYITTRFGNVLGSNGSVIPLFQKQIKEGGPITVTDERVTRYFMTIPEACQLVLEAGAIGTGGTIFVFDMGTPVKIIDLARKMIRLSGLELDKDIEIKIIGLRPGEKLYEELLADQENTLPTHHPKILKAMGTHVSPDIFTEIEALIALFDGQNNDLIVQQMKKIVPGFISNNSLYSKLDK